MTVLFSWVVAFIVGFVLISSIRHIQTMNEREKGLTEEEKDQQWLDSQW